MTDNPSRHFKAGFDSRNDEIDALIQSNDRWRIMHSDAQEEIAKLKAEIERLKKDFHSTRILPDYNGLKAQTDELATALEAMIGAAKDKGCGLKIADDALQNYRKSWEPKK